MDGGSNCRILIRKEYFISLHLKDIQCTLANGEKSRFQGIGLAIIEIQPSIFLTLAPAYLSCKDDVNTISPGALKRYSKCKEASHEALEHVKITTSKGQKLTLPTITVAGLDYLKIKAHHFKRPMKTKAERNMHGLYSQSSSSTRDNIRYPPKNRNGTCLTTIQKMIMEERSEMPRSYHLLKNLQTRLVLKSKISVRVVVSAVPTSRSTSN